MWLKDGVELHGLHPAMVLALGVANQVYAARGVDLTITSALDGKHGRASLHYVGQAADIRTRNLPPGVAERAAKEIKERLGNEFDVIVEKDHIHIEFQPK